MNRLFVLRKIFFLLMLIVFVGVGNRWMYTIASIFAAGEPSISASIDAGSVQGSNGWYTSGVTVNIVATPNSAPIKSITFWLDSGPQSTVNAATTSQTYSQNGTHTLYYFATDVNDQVSATGSTTFKVDTISPINWRNITQTRNGNSHTFEFSATVDDASAGLDPTKVYMQYDVSDTGTDYGYYSNLLACNSTWNANQWKQVTQSFSSGATTATITTPPVDYCNSAGSGCDFMKVRIYDLAGNYSDKKICLGGPWFQVQDGDVHSVSNITMNADGPQPNTDGVISTQGSTVSSFYSSGGWYVQNYTNANAVSSINYATLNSKYGSGAGSLPSGRLPTTSGVYKVNNNFTLSSTVLPSGYATAQNFATIILVNGTVTINTNINTHPSSLLMIVASGGINIDRNVAAIEGIYVSTGLFDSSYNGNSNTQLVINGSVFSEGGFDFARTLGTTNNKTTPAELIIYQPNFLFNTNLQKLISGTNRYNWSEGTP